MQTRRIISCAMMLPLLLRIGFAALPAQAAEDVYYPNSDALWETVDPESLGWDSGKLNAALDLAGLRKSSGVVILHRGRIMAERYWDSPDDSRRYQNNVTGLDSQARAIEDVASAQKSVVAVLTGMAQERGYLSIDEPVAKYVGEGWSKASRQQEDAITIRHLLSMNSGLAIDFSYVAMPDSEWLYNTPVYHELMRVLMAATGLERQQLTEQWVTMPLGMTNTAWTDRPWASSDIAVGLSTTARDLARFGLMIQRGGLWAGKAVLQDTVFLDAMLSPSQQLNPAYGYLWWLNGQEFSRATGAQAKRRNGNLIPSAPGDLVAMQGALDRKLYLVPSLDLVITRLGSAGAANDSSFNDSFWAALQQAAPSP